MTPPHEPLRFLRVLGRFQWKNTQLFASVTTGEPVPYHPWDWYIYLHLVDYYGKWVNIPYLAIQHVPFLGWWVHVTFSKGLSDLQRLVIKRSRIESPGTYPYHGLYGCGFFRMATKLLRTCEFSFGPLWLPGVSRKFFLETPQGLDQVGMENRKLNPFNSQNHLDFGWISSMFQKWKTQIHAKNNGEQKFPEPGDSIRDLFAPQNV